MLDRLSLQARVWLVIVLVIAGLAALTVVSAVETRKQQMATLTADLANHVASAVGDRRRLRTARQGGRVR